MTARSGPNSRAYARKRLARVYPAYLVLVVVVLAGMVPDAPAQAKEWFAYLTLTQVYMSGVAVTELNQTWSLATEVAFYALLPVLGWLAGRRDRGDPDRSARRQVRVLGAMVLVTLAYQLVRSWTSWLPDWLSSLWLPGYLDWFAAGMLLAVAYARLALPGQPPRARWFGALRQMAGDTTTCLVLAGMAFALAATPIAGKYFFDGRFGPDTSGPWAIITKHYLYATCAFFLLLPLVLGAASHGYARAMSSPIMRRLGVISYGLFLWHLVVLTGLDRLFGIGVFHGWFWLLWPTTVVVTTAVAQVSWVMLEQPILNRAHRSASAGRRQWRPWPLPGRG